MRPDATPIPFIDIGAQRRRLGTAIDDAVAKVLTHCQFVMGPEVRELEAELSKFCGAKHTISCASGTDALVMVLMAKGVGPGDAVFCPSFTFCATAESVVIVGATPVFVDVDEKTFNIDLASLEQAIKETKRGKLNAKAIIPVDLFGQPADLDAVAAIAKREGLFVISDAAQSFGATYKGKRVGTQALATTTSFFPAKPLGCYGDGGAIFTDDDQLADVLRSVRVHGQGTDKYDNIRIGITGRLDTIQAAVLLEKLRIFPDEIEARNRVAARYAAGLKDVAIVPEVPAGYGSVWAQYTIRVANRDALGPALQKRGVPTAIYYPKPVHRQTAYRDFPAAGNGLPVTDRISADVIALPMHPYLDEATQDRVIAAVRESLS
ncbi:MAG: DegT/DnrJ/EryC1/StrS aminotransferase family protein [Xanthobacteraceae bacterium]|nr:DegT/DnrJ/EryC1/StrS aminotransferase family protein [Xanthobacteraceae bacterium]QYK46664.1 MAG: DegT/DnrJ/EryC1/StrS aminotransferase family protein [Xanthobacteraceae bacterium]